MASEQTSEQVFFGASVLLFATSAALAIRLVRIHVGDERDADARRLDDVDGAAARLGATSFRQRIAG